MRGKLFRNLRISSVLETFMAGMAAAVFAFSAFVLIFAASKAQRGIISEKNAQSQTRTAVAYINAKIRQNDAAGIISIREMNGENAIVIHDEDKNNDVWIYCNDGYINENSGASSNEAPPENLGIPVAPADNLKIELNEERNIITFEVLYKRGSKEESISTTVKLNSKVKSRLTHN